MMLRIFFIIIILYIIIQNLLDNYNIQSYSLSNDSKIIQNNLKINSNQNIIVDNQNIKLDNQNIKSDNQNTKLDYQNIIFDNPNPWTKLIYNKNDDYPYNFYLKIKISSLNDYQKWKKIIPNLNFNANTGELIIPSKDEASALAIANLISNNFMGKISLQNILEKNLIQISINKSQNYEVVQNKLREQINENLYDKIKIKPNYENDLINIEKNKNSKVDFINLNNSNDSNNLLKLESDLNSNNLLKNELQDLKPNIQESLYNFTSNNYERFDNDNNLFEPFEGSDYSYL